VGRENPHSRECIIGMNNRRTGWLSASAPHFQHTPRWSAAAAALNQRLNRTMHVAVGAAVVVPRTPLRFTLTMAAMQAKIYAVSAPQPTASVQATAP
jgi:hypothetical protein